MSYCTELSSYKVNDNLDDSTAYIQHQDIAGPDEIGPFDAPSGKWIYADGTVTGSIDNTMKVYRTTS